MTDIIVIVQAACPQLDQVFFSAMTPGRRLRYRLVAVWMLWAGSSWVGCKVGRRGCSRVVICLSRNFTKGSWLDKVVTLSCILCNASVAVGNLARTVSYFRLSWNRWQGVYFRYAPETIAAPRPVLVPVRLQPYSGGWSPPRPSSMMRTFLEYVFQT